MLALLFSMVVPTPAWAAPPEEEVAGLPVPDSVPEWVWRADTRHPTEWGADEDGGGAPPIFEDGFRPKGEAGSWNDNLADHVLNTEQPNRSAWVSTSYDQEEAISFGKTNLEDAGSFWEYRVAPDESFWSVQTSFKEALLPGGEYDEALADRFETAKDSWMGDVEGEAEFAAFGEVGEKNIADAREWVWDAESGQWNVGETLNNPRFARPTTQPSLEPYGIPDSGACYGGARSTCAPPIDDESDLVDVHQGRFDGDLDDFDFSLRTDALREDESLLLAPAPDSVELVADAEAGLHTPADFAEFTDGLAGSFEADATALSEVTTEVSVIDRVAESMDVVVDTTAEILPYFGIAATGWAMQEDLSHGDWGDLAADTIAEGLQMAMLEAPEFDPILVPLLFVDVIAKEIGDWAWAMLHPAPEYSEAYRNQLEQANDQVDKVPGLLLGAWEKERNTVFEQFYGEKVEGRLADSIATKIRSDIAVLRAMDAAAVREVVRYEFRARAHATTDTERARVAIASARAQAEVHAVTRDAVEDRVGQYRDRYGKVVDATAAATWNLDLDEIAQQFTEDEHVSTYLTKVSEIAFEAYFQKPFDALPVGEKEIAQARGSEERAALRALVPTVEKRRLWAGPEPGETAAYAEGLRRSVERAVAKDREFPPIAKTTTLGVHDLRVRPTDGSAFGYHAPGTVSWQQQIGSGALPVDAAKGDTLSWDVDLPDVLQVESLPAAPTVAGWRHDWTERPGGLRLTATKTNDLADGLAGRYRHEIDVRWTGTAPVAPAVSVLFSAPRGHQSVAPTAFAAVRTGDFEALPSEPSEIRGGKTTVRFSARITSYLFEIRRGVIETATVSGMVFPNNGTVVAWRRTTPDSEWKRASQLDLQIRGGTSRLLAIGNGGYLDAEAGGEVRWEIEAGVRGGDDARHDIPFTLASNAGLGMSATKSVTRVGGTTALASVGLPAPTLAYDRPTKVPIAARVTGQPMASLGRSDVELRAPEGTSFSPTTVITATNLAGTALPNATIRDVRLSGDARTVTGTIAGGSMNLAVGDQVRWNLEARAHAKSSGAASVRVAINGSASSGPIATVGSQPVTVPELPRLALSLRGPTPIKPGESTSVVFDVRPTAAVSGVTYTLRAPRNGFIGTNVVTVSGGGTHTGEFNRDRTELTVTVPDGVPVSGSTVSAVVGLHPDAVEFPVEAGWLRASGPVVTQNLPFTMRFAEGPPEVPDPGKADIAIHSPTAPAIRQGETGTVTVRLENVGERAASIGIAGTFPAQTGIDKPYRVTYRTSPIGQATALTASTVGAGFRVDAGLPTVQPGQSIWVAFPLKNIDVSWEETVYAARLTVVERDTGAEWGAAYAVRSVLPTSKVVLRCWSSNAGASAEVRLSWAEQDNGYYKATIEQTRFSGGASGWSDSAKIGLQLQTDGYEGAWRTTNVRRTTAWSAGGPDAWAYVRKPKLLIGLLDVQFDAHPAAWSPTCSDRATLFKN